MAPLLDMGVPRLLKQLAVRHTSGAGGFASEAADAFRCVMVCPLVGHEGTVVFLRPEADASTGRVVFVAGQLVRWADGETKAAVRAVRKMRFRSAGML